MRIFRNDLNYVSFNRDLPELSRHYVMRMLFVDQAVAQAVVSSWVSFSSQSDHGDAIKPLGNARVWWNRNVCDFVYDNGIDLAVLLWNCFRAASHLARVADSGRFARMETQRNLQGKSTGGDSRRGSSLVRTTSTRQIQ